MKYRTRPRRGKRVIREGPSPNPLRVDPTRTGGLRRELASALGKRFDSIKAAVLKLIGDEDALGLRPSSHDPFAVNVTENALLGRLFGGGKKSVAALSGGDCGTGSGGFKPGNTCAAGGGVRGTGTPAGPGSAEPPAQVHIHSPQFKQWFGDWQSDPAGASKVVDHKTGEPKQTAGADLVESGGPRPLVVYHGTAHGAFSEFRSDKIAHPNELYYGPGFYFTEDVHAAEVFAHSQHSLGVTSHPTVMKLYLNVRKPFDADAGYVDHTKLPPSELHQLRSSIVAKAFHGGGRSDAREAGEKFDSGGMKFRYRDLTETHGVSKVAVNEVLKAAGHDGITVTSPEVAGKTAPGTNRYWIVFEPTQVKSVTNRGTFDPHDPVITNFRVLGNTSYFGSCPRDSKGHCEPSGSPGALPGSKDELEDHFYSKYHTNLTHRGGSDAEFHAVAAYAAETYDRLSGYKAVAVAFKTRKAHPQTLEIGVNYTGDEKHTQAKYTYTKGIETRAGVKLDPGEAPAFGGHTVGNGLASAFRHELGHEVYNVGLTRGKQKEWNRLTDKYIGTAVVSRYGGTNNSELFSESFSAYTSPHYKRGSLPADIEKWLDKNVRGEPKPTANTWNVFCPTGPKGGVDPTCSPGTSDSSNHEVVRVGIEGHLVEVHKNPTKEGLTRWLKSKGLDDQGNTRDATHELRGFVLDDDAYFWDSLNESGKDVYHNDVASAVVGIDYPMTSGRFTARINKGELKLQAYASVKSLRAWASKRGITANTRWKFQAGAGKVTAFGSWLDNQITSKVLDPGTKALTDRAALVGYKKGLTRAHSDVRRPAARGYGDAQSLLSRGSEDEFLRLSFGKPETAEKVNLLASRSFTDLKGVTDAMSAAMSRTLADGLSRGAGPDEIARDLVKDVDGIGKTRAMMIARTEIVRAHAEGQLDAMEAMGVEEVGAAVEWDTAHDFKVCRLCAPLQGMVIKISEARGMIPRHPHCRCAWTPQVAPAPAKGLKLMKKSIDRAVSASTRAGDDAEDWGPAVRIGTARPGDES